MNRNPPTTTAFSQSRPSISRRISRRRSTASSVEAGVNGGTVPEEQRITEEIAQIKRYEDFTTIDWVQDAALEQVRRRARRKGSFFGKDGAWGWRRKVWQSYDAAQAWIVVTLVGIIIGFTAAVLNIATEYLSDVKLGYCTRSWYLNEDFCCFGEDNGCDAFVHWTRFTVANYFIYAIFAILLSFTAAFLVQAYAPYAAGSGISEIKCIIAGFVMKGFLGFWTFFIKAITLPIAIASGLSVGKEGPSVHYAVCVGNIVSRYFDKYKQSASKTREILTATSAAGVAVAFGSPIGGVLFSLEEMSSHFPLKTLWRSFFCALVATAVLSAMDPFRTGQLVMFSVRYDRDWHLFEIVFYVIIGVFGGLYGAFMIKLNLQAQAFRKKYLTKYPIHEAVVLAAATALICYPNVFLRIDMTEMMEIMFKECEGNEDFHGLCESSQRWRMVWLTLTATILRAFFVIISYGCKVPAGIFVPSMAIGASFGRMVGILVQWLHEKFPDAAFFATCQPDVPCITPGTYAFLGAGAALSGIMHITLSVAVIMFELTGALTYILPTMIVVGVTKAIGDRLSNGGIADRMIWFNGFPFLDNKEEHSFGVSASQVMTPSSRLQLLPAKGLQVGEAYKLLDDTSFSGFPVVENLSSKILIGYIGRIELQYALEKTQKMGFRSPNGTITFISPNSTSAAFSDPADAETEDQPISPILQSPSQAFDSHASRTIDFSSLVDTTPLTVHPRLPLETTMELFQKMGPRVILVDHHGVLQGLITVKDCLKYQFKVEAQEHLDRGLNHGTSTPRLGHEPNAREEIRDMLLSIPDRFIDWFNGLSRGKLKLRTRRGGVGRARGNDGDRPSGSRHDGWARLPLHSRAASQISASDPAADYVNDGGILDGTEDLDELDELDHSGSRR